MCRAQNVTYVATKKTLLKRALKEIGFDVDTKVFEGSPAVVLGLQDEVAPAQIVAKFAKSHEIVHMFGGMLEGQAIDSTKVTELSKLPSKDELLAKMVGSLNAPIARACKCIKQYQRRESVRKLKLLRCCITSFVGNEYQLQHLQQLKHL